MQTYTAQQIRGFLGSMMDYVNQLNVKEEQLNIVVCDGCDESDQSTYALELATMPNAVLANNEEEALASLAVMRAVVNYDFTTFFTNAFNAYFNDDCTIVGAMGALCCAHEFGLCEPLTPYTDRAYMLPARFVLRRYSNLLKAEIETKLAMLNEEETPKETDKPADEKSDYDLHFTDVYEWKSPEYYMGSLPKKDCKPKKLRKLYMNGLIKLKEDMNKTLGKSHTFDKLLDAIDLWAEATLDVEIPQDDEFYDDIVDSCKIEWSKKYPAYPVEPTVNAWKEASVDLYKTQENLVQKNADGSEFVVARHSLCHDGLQVLHIHRKNNKVLVAETHIIPFVKHWDHLDPKYIDARKEFTNNLTKHINKINVPESGLYSPDVAPFCQYTSDCLTLDAKNFKLYGDVVAKIVRESTKRGVFVVFTYNGATPSGLNIKVFASKDNKVAKEEATKYVAQNKENVFIPDK